MSSPSLFSSSLTSDICHEYGCVLERLPVQNVPTRYTESFLFQAPVTQYPQSDSTTTSSELFPIHTSVIIIPGNPGTATFYGQFAADLWSKLQSHEDVPASFKRNSSIRIMNLAGYILDEKQSFQQQSLSQLADQPVVATPHLYSLNEQLLHIWQYLQAVQQQYWDTEQKQVRFILVGHSIGGWFAFQTLQKSLFVVQELARHTAHHHTQPHPSQPPSPPPIVIQHVYALFPFVRNDLSTFQLISFKFFFLLFRIFRFLPTLFSYFPYKLLRWILTRVLGMNDQASILSRSIYFCYCIPYLAKQCLYMGQAEFNYMKNKQQWVKEQEEVQATQSYYQKLLTPSQTSTTPTNTLIDAKVYNPNNLITPSSTLNMMHNVQEDGAAGQYVPVLQFASLLPFSTLYFANKKHDMWAPIEQCYEFRNTYSASLSSPSSSNVDKLCKTFQIENQATHAFCAFQDESFIMAQRVFHDMKDLLFQTQTHHHPTQPRNIESSSQSEETAAVEKDEIEKQPLLSRL